MSSTLQARIMCALIDRRNVYVFADREIVVR